jgi:hypothetical protein
VALLFAFALGFAGRVTLSEGVGAGTVAILVGTSSGIIVAVITGTAPFTSASIISTEGTCSWKVKGNTSNHIHRLQLILN